MSRPHTFTAAVHQEEDWYVAQCLEVDVASQGHTIDEALTNLAEAAGLYLGHAPTPIVTLVVDQARARCRCSGPSSPGER